MSNNTLETILTKPLNLAVLIQLGCQQKNRETSESHPIQLGRVLFWFDADNNLCYNIPSAAWTPADKIQIANDLTTFLKV